MKVAVTGATGHLGRAVVRELAARHEVLGYSSTTLDLAKDVRLEPVDALVHLAAWHPPATAATTAEDRRRLLEVNVLGTMRALEAARAKVVIYASTFEVYGLPLATPVDEAHPTRPLTDYGATKLAGEDHAIAYGYEEKARVVCLRMPAIHGPGEKTPRLLPNCLRRVARGERPLVSGDGGDLRDQLYVDDAARAVALALEGAARGVFNVSDGAAHSVLEVARLAMALAGLRGEPEVGPRQKPRVDFHMSIERARRELGFEPRVSLEEGMRRQLAAIRAEGGAAG